MLESGRGTSPARAAAPRMSEASTAGWSCKERHVRSSGDSAAAGKFEPGARSGVSTAGHQQFAQHAIFTLNNACCRYLEYLHTATADKCGNLAMRNPSEPPCL